MKFFSRFFQMVAGLLIAEIGEKSNALLDVTLSCPSSESYLPSTSGHSWACTITNNELLLSVGQFDATLNFDAGTCLSQTYTIGDCCPSQCCSTTSINLASGSSCNLYFCNLDVAVSSSCTQTVTVSNVQYHYLSGVTLLSGSTVPSSADITISISPSPTPSPTRLPTTAPTHVPTRAPTAAPTHAPTRAPTRTPTHVPTRAPTRTPTHIPTRLPTAAPTHVPTHAPTRTPTHIPTRLPTAAPTHAPTRAPTRTPTHFPTPAPAPSPMPLGFYFKEPKECAKGIRLLSSQILEYGVINHTPGTERINSLSCSVSDNTNLRCLIKNSRKESIEKASNVCDKGTILPVQKSCDLMLEVSSLIHDNSSVSSLFAVDTRHEDRFVKVKVYFGARNQIIESNPCHITPLYSENDEQTAVERRFLRTRFKENELYKGEENNFLFFSKLNSSQSEKTQENGESKHL